MAVNATPLDGAGAIATVVDAHVHIYDYLAPDVALDIAAGNFERHAGEGDHVGVLFVADPANARFAETVREAASRHGGFTQWRLQETDEACCFVARRGRQQLLLILGQQLATAEKLEVLAFGTEQPVDGRLALEDTLAAIERLRGMSIVPWGLGKWTGPRGRRVERILERAHVGRLFLGDNGGRPAGWRVPQFESARQKNVRVLRGTDPLPIVGDEARIGSFGFGLTQAVDPERPLAALLETLADPAAALIPLGRPTSIARTISNQIRLRARPLAHA